MALMTSSLSAFADDHLGGEPGVDLSSVGPETARIRDDVGDPAMASPLIANVCWLTFVRTVTFTDLLREARLSPEDAQSWRAYVIRHPIFAGEPRHDLIVFGDNYSREAPYTIDSLPLSSELIENGFLQLLRELRPHVEAHRDSYLRRFEVETVHEAFQAQKFGMIVTRQPDLLATGLPPTHWQVKRAPELTDFSTAGIVARNGDGALGVTAALHPLWDTDTGILRTSIEVAGVPSFIRSIHRNSDSAFAELRRPIPRSLDLPAARQIRTQHPGSVPRNEDDVSFDGSASDYTNTFVVGWSVDLPLRSATREQNILTDARTAPGDSGSALVTEEDRLLGFSASRTAFDQVPEFSIWRSAEYVLNVHELHIWNEPRDDFLMRVIRDSEKEGFTVDDEVVQYVFTEGVADRQAWTRGLVNQEFNEVEIGNILKIALEEARIETVVGGHDRLELGAAKGFFEEVVRKRFNCPFPLLLC
jgi:hypothetical protein